MTYCVGMLLDEGLVIIADTRTNAGIDNVSTYRKLSIFHHPDHSVMAIASAGNLSVSQSVISLLTEGFLNPVTNKIETLDQAETMFQAAQMIGRAIRHIKDIDGPSLEQVNLPFDVSFLFGGQIKGGALHLYMIYAAGNFIECSQDAPFLQIGEHKYGKPILDRSVHYKSDPYDALKIGLISMDSTIRSNIGVGLPIDIAIIRKDALTTEVSHRIEAGEPYFHDLRERWSAALRAAHNAIPRPNYGFKKT